MIDPTTLVALALEVEKEGQYNTAKLLRAAATALVNRAAAERAVPTEPGTQADELVHIAGELAGTPAAALSGALKAAAAAVRASRVPLYSEAPDPYVCRTCGETRLAGFDARCEHCGRWPSTAEPHRPIYWQRASTPIESLELLSSTRATVTGILRSGASDVPGPDGGWTAHDTLQHLHNAQTVFRGRIDQLLAGGEPELASVMVWTMDGNDLTTPELLDAYLRTRAEIVEVLSGADPKTWWNAGHHEEFGRVTLAEQASYFANHEPTHLAQLADAARM